MRKIFFSTALFSLGMIGCTQSPEQPNASNDSQPEEVTTTETEENITEIYQSPLPDDAPVLKVGSTGIQPPFSFQDQYGNLQGIDIDVIRAIGEDQGFKVEFYQDKWKDLFDSVEAGDRDIAISGISYKPDRDEKYGLSESYFFNPSGIMYANKSLTINGIEDLSGLRVGGVVDSKQIAQVEEMGKAKSIKTEDTTHLLLGSMLRGEIDVVVQDMPLLQYTATSYPEHEIEVIAYEDESDPLAQQVILMKKDNKSLIDSVNQGIQELKTSGKLEDIEQKWLSGKTSTSK